MTPSIYFIVLVIVLGTLALGWSFYRRQQFKRAPEPGYTSRSVSLPGKHMPALRTRLGSALVALSFAGLTLLLGPQPHALAAGGCTQPFGYDVPHLDIDQYLTDGQYLVSACDRNSSGGHYFAIMQSDGNFCTYKGTGPSNNQGYVWCIRNTALPQGNYFAIMQSDGNFVVYKGTGPSDNQGVVWATGTYGSGATQAVLQDDGNFVLDGPMGSIQGPDESGFWCNKPTYWSSSHFYGATYPVFIENYCW